MNINNQKTIYLNSYNAIKIGNEYIFNIRPFDVKKPSKLILENFIFSSSSNLNIVNNFKIKNIEYDINSYYNNDNSGHPNITSLMFDYNLPDLYSDIITTPLITPSTIGSDVIFNFNEINEYSITLPKDTYSDILCVGGGGCGGGTGNFGGGGGGGEIIKFDNIYMPSGTYNISIRDNLNYNPTDVRLYPPKTYNTLGAITGTGPYYRTMTLDNTGLTYGDGDYILGCSSYTSPNTPEGPFNRIISTFNLWISLGSLYNSTSGIYLGSSYLKNDYLGEWITIKLPKPIYLKYYELLPYASSRSPSLFKIYGSNDGTTWEEIIQASNSITGLTTNNYPSYFDYTYAGTAPFLRYTKTLSTPSKLYQYFGLVVNKVIGGGTTSVALYEFGLYGYEDAYSTLIKDLNILSNYLDLVPKTYNSISAQTNITVNGITCYKWVLTLNNNGIEYGAGDYEIVSTGSGTYSSFYPFYCLDKTQTSLYSLSGSTYTNGIYTGSRYLIAGYLGEFFYIKLPVAKPLYAYDFMSRGGQDARLAGLWKVYGSDDGTTWTEITQASNSTTRLATTDYVLYPNGGNNHYFKTLSYPSTSYLYFGFCCNALTTGATGNQNWVVGGEVFLYTRNILIVDDIDNLNDGSVVVMKDNNIFLEAKAGGNGGYSGAIPTSGGSGGGGYLLEEGATAGTPFSSIYGVGDVNNGGDGDADSGGNGGQATTTSFNITGSSVSYGLGGTGGTDISEPDIKTLYGSGGDGNEGLGKNGCFIMRCKTVIDYNNNNYLNFSGFNINPQHINQISLINNDVNNTNINFIAQLSINEL